MLKVLKLEGSGGTAAQGSSNLSMNQTLEGHTGAVVCATWNPIYRFAAFYTAQVQFKFISIALDYY